MNGGTQRNKAEHLRKLHQESDVLVLPNAWDSLSARVFETCGFTAIATTSAGIAYTLGYPDGEMLGREEMAEATSRVAAAVKVPVTADIEAGYGTSPEDAAETARAIIEAGAVGLNLEDAADATPPGSEGHLGDEPEASQVVDLQLQLEKIRAVVQAGEEAGVPIVVNARTDLYWRSVDDPEWRFSEAVRRANAFLEAGAECVFVPGVKDPETISALAREIAGPLNVLASPGISPIPELARLGVRRVSVGSGPVRAVMGLVDSIGRELLECGTYDNIGEKAIPYPEANALFMRRDSGM
jgi:2-methylisocitrate lyase-like PEP mutase family enzyme